MQIYEFSNPSGTGWSFQTEGEFSYEDFVNEIRKQYPIETSGRHFQDVFHYCMKFGQIKAPGDNNRFINTMVKCDRNSHGSKIYSRVAML